MKFYWVFCIIKKKISGYNIKSEILLTILYYQKKFFFSWHNIRMLEITIGNCYKCDLETINDTNNIFGLIEDI